jgi:hypothetical protein
MTADSLRHEASYVWRHSASPTIRRAHAVHSRLRPIPEVQRDRLLGDGAEVLRYTGIAAGVCKVNVDQKAQGPFPQEPAMEMHATRGWAEAQRHLTGKLFSLVLPIRVNWVADRIESPETIAKSISSRERTAFRTVQARRGYELVAATDEAQFEDFYTTMYLPTMRARHGERTKGETRESALDCMFRRRGVLLLLRDREGRSVAGALCRFGGRGRSLILRLVGVREADPGLYDDGSFKALWVLVLHWAGSRGMRLVDLQGTEPFVSSGNFQWKKRLGATVGPPRNYMSGHQIVLRVDSDGPGVRSFLTANPLVEISRDGTLNAVCFHDDERPARSPRYYAARGISGIRYLDLDRMRWSMLRLPND